MSEDCDFCRLGLECGLHDPLSGSYRNVSCSSERERYQAWREFMIAKLADFDIEFPLGGSYLDHFTRFSRRF